MKRLLLTAALCCLLPSCKHWFIGEHLSGASTTYTGVDIYHPVDGKIHFATSQKGDIGLEAYVIAPEVTYHKQPPYLTGGNIHFIGDWSYEPSPRAGNIRPTGRVVTARIGYGGFREIVPRLPKGLTAFDAPTRDLDSIEEMKLRHIVCHWHPENIYPDALGELGEPRYEKPGLLRRALIGTCDYVVDPVLNVLSPVVEGAALVALSPIILPTIAIAESVQQQQSPEPDPQDSATTPPSP